jgi:site-specific DNA recombinase
VLESTIEQVLVTAINNTLSGKDTFLATLQNNIESVLTQGDDKTLAEIDKRFADLQTQLLKLASTKADYEDVANEIYQLREQKQKILVENANRDELRKRIADMSSFLQKQPAVLTEYDEPLVRRLIEKITVYEDKFTVEFKSGLTVDVNA